MPDDDDGDEENDDERNDIEDLLNTPQKGVNERGMASF